MLPILLLLWEKILIPLIWVRVLLYINMFAGLGFLIHVLINWFGSDRTSDMLDAVSECDYELNEEDMRYLRAYAARTKVFALHALYCGIFGLIGAIVVKLLLKVPPEPSPLPATTPSE